MKQSKAPEIEKFDGIIVELLRRGIVVLMHRPTRWGYVVDAVIPSAKIVILKMPELDKQVKVAMSMFRDLLDRLESDGYRVLIVPRNKMNEQQIKAFCDQIAVEPGLAAA
jgi:hypothetical protein